MDEKLLDIQDLSVWYKTYRGFAEVVDHINLYVGKGEKIGLVGESGCGKTTTMKMVMRTLDERGIKVGEGSKLLFGGEDILAMDAKALLDLRRRKISMISQSPMAALNPVFTIGQQMMDVLKYSGQFDPLHPYTQGLLACVPRLTGGGISAGIYGYIPSYVNPPKGCRFFNRCPHCTERCKQEKPGTYMAAENHAVSCFLYEDKGPAKERGDGHVE